MTRRLRVTFVLLGRGLAGGVRVVVQYANSLIERGHVAEIVCLKRPLPRRPMGLAKYVYDRFVPGDGATSDHLHEFKGAVREAPIARLADQVHDGDAVVATHCKTAACVNDLPTSKGAKFYFIQHYEAHTFDPVMVDASWHFPMRKIVVARWLQDIAKERFGDDTALVVTNGIDLEQFDAPPRAMHHPPAVGLMYSSRPWKGVGVAFDAIRRARKVIPDLRTVCLAMDRPDADLELPADVDLFVRPAQEQLREVYARANVWLLPSETEGFGLPGLEAMACRCPVVATRCGGPEEFVQDGVNGYLVEVGDIEAMAERITRVLQDTALHTRLSHAAFETRLRFDVHDSALAFERALFRGLGEASVADPRAAAQRAV